MAYGSPAAEGLVEAGLGDCVAAGFGEVVIFWAGFGTAGAEGMLGVPAPAFRPVFGGSVALEVAAELMPLKGVT